MPVLTMDEVSAKTLPLLDRLVQTDKSKFLELLEKTDGPALDRLILASIARINHIGYVQPGQPKAVNLVEEFVRSNLLTNVDEDEVRMELVNILRILETPVKRSMLAAAILRFTLLQ